jgi:hypothetical protein
LLEIEYVFSVVEGVEKMIYDRGYEYKILSQIRHLNRLLGDMAGLYEPGY